MRRGCVSAAKRLPQASNTEELRCVSTGSTKDFPQGKGGSCKSKSTSRSHSKHHRHKACCHPTSGLYPSPGAGPDRFRKANPVPACSSPITSHGISAPFLLPHLHEESSGPSAIPGHQHLSIPALQQEDTARSSLCQQRDKLPLQKLCLAVPKHCICKLHRGMQPMCHAHAS